MSFCGHNRSSESNTRIITPSMPRPLPSTSYINRFSLIILLFDVTYSELLPQFSFLAFYFSTLHLAAMKLVQTIYAVLTNLLK